MSCSEVDCLDVSIADLFPDGLAGFEVVDASVSPADTAATITWTPGGGSDAPATLEPGAGITVDVQNPTDNPEGVGMTAGSTVLVTISLRVPDDYPPGEPVDVVNVATAEGSNANPVQDDATIAVDAPVSIGVGTTKDWSPDRQDFNPGSSSTIAIGVENTSNVVADSLVIQEPAGAVDGATSLDADNPFTAHDFAGFGATQIPAQCDSVQVDVYVFEGGQWVWRTGPPSDVLALPEGVTNADVGGIRVTCVGDLPPGTQFPLEITVEQRATERETGDDLSLAENSITNTATGTVTVGDETASEDASAEHTVVPAVPGVETQKDISPGQITAGQNASATLSATNGDQPVSEMVISDRDFFTEDVAFGGFSSAPVWPAGATSGTVVYVLADGTEQEVPFTNGAIPDPPAGAITGFDIVFTGNLIEAGATASVPFVIETTEDAAGGQSTVTLTNEVTSTVTAPNGQTATETDSDTLVIVDPDVEVTIDKSIRPSTPVSPGESVISSLETNATAVGDGAIMTDIVVEDVSTGAEDDFWEAFNLSAIAPTQVPANTTLTVEVYGPAGWQTIAVTVPQSSASIFQMTPAELAAALAPLTPDDITGIRFTFTNPDGFPADTTVTPNIVFDARDELRTSGEPTADPDNPGRYTNEATAEVEGESEGGRPLTDDDSDTAQAIIETDEGGPGPVDIDKRWTSDFVDAQSGDRADTEFRWNVAAGYSPVTVTETPRAGSTRPPRRCSTRSTSSGSTRSRRATSRSRTGGGCGTTPSPPSSCTSTARGRPFRPPRVRG